MLFLDRAANFCLETANIWSLIGWVIFILKIVIPLLLIVFGMLDLGKAVIASDEKAINKAVNTLLHRFIAAVVVFFVPTIVIGLFNLLMNFDIKSRYTNCVSCVLNVSDTNSCKRGEAISIEGIEQ